jgi:hypothetical protein
METQEISKWDKKYLKIFTIKSIIGIVVGVIGGYIYYIKIGCNSGTCPITSNPWMSMLWGAIIGYLLGGMFEKEPKKK